MLTTIQESRTPNLLWLEYARPDYVVRNLTVVHRGLLSESAIVTRRSPLSGSARRHGWLACYIDLSQIPRTGRLDMARAGIPSPPEQVRVDWRSLGFLEWMAPTRRGWLADVLARVEELPNQPFALGSAHRYAMRHLEDDPIRFATGLTLSSE